MNKKILSAVLGSLIISFLGCDIINSAISSKQLNPNSGELSDHSDLPNDSVTVLTKDSVGLLLIKSFYIPCSSFRNGKSSPYIRSNSDTTYTIDSIYKVDGEYDGYAEIKQYGSVSGNLSSDDLKINYAYFITYYDYSNDGKIFIGGEAEGTANYTSDQEDMSVKLNGHVKFNGLYTGECKYNMNVLYLYSDDQLDYSGDMKIISDNEEYVYSINEIK